jgi:S1-C subfamily serine protease
VLLPAPLQAKRPMAVRLEVAGIGNGSGVVVSDDGHILTCAHVLGDAETAVAVLERPGKTSWSRATRVAVDPSRDLALVKINPSGVEPAKIAERGPVVRETGVFLIGPGGRDRTLSAGTIVKPAFSIDMRPARPVAFKGGMLAELRGEDGQSGGGVFDADGALLGIFMASVGRDQALIIGPDEIRAFLRENGLYEQ